MTLLEAINKIDRALSLSYIQPIKTSRELSNGMFCDVLPAFTEDGTVGAKVILRDEATGFSKAIVVAASATSDIRSTSEPALTPTRCGLVVAAAARRVRPFGTSLRVGVVGYGAIGRTVCDILSKLYLTTTVVLQSPRKNPNRDPSILADCDVIVTATSTREGDQPLVFNPDWKAQAYLSLDGGFMIGPTFRHLPSRSDYPAQLDHAYEAEFPFDTERTLFHSFDAPLPSPWCGFFYGCGVADLITMEYLNAGF